MTVDEERLEAAATNSIGEKEGAKGQVKLLRARGSAELGKVVSDSATQGLSLEDRKVASWVIGEDRSQLCRRGRVGEVMRGGR